MEIIFSGRDPSASYQYPPTDSSDGYRGGGYVGEGGRGSGQEGARVRGFLTLFSKLNCSNIDQKCQDIGIRHSKFEALL